MSKPGSTFIGIMLVVVSAAGFGTLAIFGRFAYANGMDIFTLLFLRFSLAAVLMGALLAVRRVQPPRGSALIRLIGMGALGYVSQAFAYFTAIKYASAGLVALLLYLYPTFVTLLSMIFLHESISPRKLLALGVALAGTALTVSPGGGQWTGILLAIAGAVVYSIYIIVGAGVMKEVSAQQSSLVIFASAGAVFGCLAFANGAHFPVGAMGWMLVLAMVILATIIPVVAFLAGIERIGPSNAAMFSTLEPVVTVLLAAIFFGETLKPVSLLGGGLILVAVLLLTNAEINRRELPHEVSIKNSGD